MEIVMTDQNNQNKNQPMNPGKGVDQGRDKQRPDQPGQGKVNKTKE